jgi:TatD DNase family protein
MNLRLCDAHNHLHDARFAGRQSALIAECVHVGVSAMVVNGSCEEDWPQVRDLAQHVNASPGLKIIPSFGCHPWYLPERTPQWCEQLIQALDSTPSAVGEIGLDRWKPGLSYNGQEEAFVAQLQIAAARNLPASIHCLQAWGRMLELLQAGPRPACGFLLHSYGGPKEMVDSFAELGGYFSLPGYYARDGKDRQRETFKHVPLDRLLIETDAPDQSPPESRKGFPLTEAASGRALNHPANLRAVYAFASELTGVEMETLAARVENNFCRLFGGVLP